MSCLDDSKSREGGRPRLEDCLSVPMGGVRSLLLSLRHYLRVNGLTPSWPNSPRPFRGRETAARAVAGAVTAAEGSWTRWAPSWNKGRPPARATAASPGSGTESSATKDLCLGGYSSREDSSKVMLLVEMDDDGDLGRQLRPTSRANHGEYWMSPARARSACEPDGETRPERAQSRRSPGGLEKPAVRVASLGAENLQSSGQSMDFERLTNIP